MPACKRSKQPLVRTIFLSSFDLLILHASENECNTGEMSEEVVESEIAIKEPLSFV